MSHSNDLQLLIEGHLANTLEAAQQERLVELLRADPAARRSVLEYMDLNAELQWSLQSRRGATLATEVAVPESSGASPDLAKTSASAPPIVLDVSEGQPDTTAHPLGSSIKPWTALLGGLVTFCLL